MIDLDLKDRKILYELDLNCRQSNAQIGKKVGLSRKVVEYRIKRMEDDGIIINYYTVIDSYKFGYTFYRFYIKFQYVSSELKKEIIQHFVNYKKISTVSIDKVIFDLIVVFWVNDNSEFYSFWEKTLVKYGDYFSEIKFSIYIKGYGYPSSYLIEEKENPNRKEIEIFGVNKRIEIDKIDYKLLNFLALKARAPLIKIVKELGISSQSVSYRIKNLIKNGIIQAFRVAFDLQKLQLIRYKVNIFLKEHDKRIDIVKYIETLPNLLYYSISIGLCDLEFEIIAKNTDYIIDIMEKVEKKFPKSIRNYNYFSGITPYKETFLPEMEFKLKIGEKKW